MKSNPKTVAGRSGLSRTAVVAAHSAGRPYKAVGAAETLFYSRQREVLLVGPAGTGKTRAALEKLFLCLQNHPGMRALLVRKTRLSLTQSALVTWETKVIPQGHPMLSGTQRAYRSSYTLANGSQLVLGSMDNVDRIMSTEYDLILACEATELTLEDWEKLLTRLRNGAMSFHQAIAECNPSFPAHWLNQRANAGLMQRLISRHEDNPLLFDAATGKWTDAGTEYLQTLGRLSGARREHLLLGVWSQPEGLVYPTLASSVVDFTFAPDENRPTAYVGLDWGWSDPLAAVVGVVDRQGVLHIVEEIYAEKLPIENLISQIAVLADKWNIDLTFADPARPEHIDTFLRSRIACRPPPLRSIEAGIALVESRLLARRLTISPRCVNLLSEAAEYRYATSHAANSGPLALAGRDHAMDALRYLVAGIDGRAGGDTADSPSIESSSLPARVPSRFSFARIWGE